MMWYGIWGPILKPMREVVGERHVSRGREMVIDRIRTRNARVVHIVSLFRQLEHGVLQLYIYSLR